MELRNAMQHALALAAGGRGRVEPNPMVGAVLLRDNQIIAQGFHEQYGGPHAEILCLNDAKNRGHDPTGCTVVVTLEPCAHEGKTPPCVKALIDSGIARVVAAMQDPFPHVAGRGFAMLREAGITVEVGLCEAEAHRLNEPFVKKTTTGLPWIIAKWAQTLDGRVATASGDSQWISNAASRTIVHEYRARVDAIMVGIGTIMADDAQLTARDVEIRRKARRIIIDPYLRIKTDAKIISQSLTDAPVLIATTAAGIQQNACKASALQTSGVELFELAEVPADEGLPLAPLLRHLADQYGATNILVEGGPTMLGHLLKQNLIDQLLTFIAPRLLGDVTARAAIEGLATPLIVAGTTLDLINIQRIDDDVLLDYRVKSHE